MNEPIPPSMLLAYFNPYTGEVVRERVSRNDADRACEALRGQSVTKLGLWYHEDRAWMEAEIKRWNQLNLEASS